MTENHLVIRGGKKHSSNKQSSGYSRFKESQTNFAQAISLPCEIDRDHVKARFKNGLLTVTIPRAVVNSLVMIFLTMVESIKRLSKCQNN